MTLKTSVNPPRTAFDYLDLMLLTLPKLLRLYGPPLYPRTADGTEAANADLAEWLHELDWFDPGTWYQINLDLFFKPHKNNHERFNLFLFLWSNGMKPRDAMHAVLWHGGYDYAAIRDMYDVYKAATMQHGFNPRTRDRLMRTKTQDLYWEGPVVRHSRWKRHHGI